MIPFVIQKPHRGQTIHLYPDHACNGLVKNGCIFNSIYTFKITMISNHFHLLEGPSATLPRIIIYLSKKSAFFHFGGLFQAVNSNSFLFSEILPRLWLFSEPG